MVTLPQKEFISGSNPSATTCDSLSLFPSLLLLCLLTLLAVYSFIHFLLLSPRAVCPRIASHPLLVHLAPFLHLICPSPSASFAVTVCPYSATGLVHLRLRPEEMVHQAPSLGCYLYSWLDRCVFERGALCRCFCMHSKVCVCACVRLRAQELACVTVCANYFITG